MMSMTTKKSKKKPRKRERTTRKRTTRKRTTRKRTTRKSRTRTKLTRKTTMMETIFMRILKTMKAMEKYVVITVKDVESVRVTTSARGLIPMMPVRIARDMWMMVMTRTRSNFNEKTRSMYGRV